MSSEVPRSTRAVHHRSRDQSSTINTMHGVAVRLCRRARSPIGDTSINPPTGAITDVIGRPSHEARRRSPRFIYATPIIGEPT